MVMVASVYHAYTTGITLAWGPCDTAASACRHRLLVMALHARNVVRSPGPQHSSDSPGFRHACTLSAASHARSGQLHNKHCKDLMWL